MAWFFELRNHKVLSWPVDVAQGLQGGTSTSVKETRNATPLSNAFHGLGKASLAGFAGGTGPLPARRPIVALLLAREAIKRRNPGREGTPVTPYRPTLSQ